MRAKALERALKKAAYQMARLAVGEPERASSECRLRGDHLNH